MKGRRAGLAGGLALALLCQPVAAECLVTGEALTVGADAAIVMEAESGAVLFAQAIHEPLPMASTTKLMTALLTLEQPELYREFAVDKAAIQVEGSSMGLMEGDRATLYALAVGMLLSSGNDAAGAAAVRIAGGCEEFASLMNERAAALGMNNTCFVTPSGLDAEGHHSTAYDMALLARAALQNPLLREIAAARRMTVSYGAPPYARTLLNHNRLLSLYTDAIGLKTGFTKKAGRCLVSAAEREGVRLICVTLHCPDDWNTHAALYDRYFALTEPQPLCHEPLMLPVVGGVTGQVAAVQQSELATVAASGQPEALDCRIFCRNFYYAPILEGDILGKIVYYKGERAIAESNLVAAAAVEAVAPTHRRGLFR